MGRYTSKATSYYGQALQRPFLQSTPPLMKLSACQTALSFRGWSTHTTTCSSASRAALHRSGVFVLHAGHLLRAHLGALRSLMRVLCFTGLQALWLADHPLLCLGAHDSKHLLHTLLTLMH